MARIATICTDERRGTDLIDMASIRWLKISEALAKLGHEVDILTGRYKLRLRQPVGKLGPRLWEVPLSKARWKEYDLVKTLFHRGFETLERLGKANHPFLISKLGSVVGPVDREGIYFYGKQREALFRVQERIQESSRFITLLTEPAKALWRESHGDNGNLLTVPGAADAEIPDLGPDPYPRVARPRVVFAGNFYSRERISQPEAHEVLAQKLNALGRLLRTRGIYLFVIGPGDARSLDPAAVDYMGKIPYSESWDYLRHADVGLVVSAGPFMHNNESTKIYHYLRVGLPVVSESGFPNDPLIGETGFGILVPPGNSAALCSAVEEALCGEGDREEAMSHILKHHTWDIRAQVYQDLIAREL